MFRFSCFNTHTQSHKQKKMDQLSAEKMQKTLEDSLNIKAQKNFTYLTDSNSSNLKAEVDAHEICADCPIDTPAVEGHSNSDDDETTQENPVPKVISIKKSHSLGAGLDMNGRDSGGSASEDGMDQQFSSDGSHDNGASLVPNVGKDLPASLSDQFEEALYAHEKEANLGSVFPAGGAPHSDKESHQHPNDDIMFSAEGNNGGHSPCTPIFEKSSSLPNIDSPGHFVVGSLRRIRSAEDLNFLGCRRKETMTRRLRADITRRLGRDDTLISYNEKNHSSNHVDDAVLTYNYVGSAKDWVVPLGDDNLGGNSSYRQGNELPSKDFKVRRIEDWVSDLQNCNPLDESEPISALDDYTNPPVRGFLDASSATKLEGKFSPGKELVKRYISSLSPSATAAQLANYGLDLIPFLSPFSSLRALNLSGNAIVRITAGSLPRGLHILNLSKNKISTVEGLRELTRLRVLDLSYNRILRIGHGLASCSSLKELYIAGNKISEVEGLHRLLKLNVLDLRFNKISTTKCLGQLAANYNSLQAISLEGNPAQKNIGDEQVKKYLLGLLPHLSYFNRQPIKVGALKDTADRSARVAISGGQMDRSLKADLKLMRKGAHAAATSKVTSASSHGRRSQAAAASRSSKVKNARLPPTGGSKPVIIQQNYLSNTLLSFKSDLSMRRSRSEGNLGVL